MASLQPLRKTKLTITISEVVARKIDKIAKGKQSPRSQVMEEMLCDWLRDSKKNALEKEIEAYYHTLSEEEKKDDGAWVKIATDSAKGLWDD